MNIRITDEDNNFLTRTVKDLDTGRMIDLPHGSGIDSDWNVEDKGGYYRCENAYHYMNEYGFYMGWQYFYLTIPKKHPQNFKLHFLSEYRYWTQKLMLRDYLEEMFAMVFADLEEPNKYTSTYTEKNLKKDA